MVALDGTAPGWTPWAGWLATAAPAPVSRVVGDDHVLYQMYTSGTTGRPKGALLTHRAVTSNLAQFPLAFEPHFGERWLLVVPMHHASGAVTSFAAVNGGGCLVIQRDFNPVEVVLREKYWAGHARRVAGS